MINQKIKREQDLTTQLINADKVYVTMYGLHKSKDRILEIKTSDISHYVFDWYGEPAFIYVWGFLGPDYNVYKMSDYGQTWAFTEKELVTDARGEE